MKANKTIRWKVTDEERGSLFVGETNPLYKRLYYRKNHKTIAPKNSIGCFCFKYKYQAKKLALIDDSPSFPSDKIVRVKTYGKVIKLSKSDCLYLPEGTICYPAVMPLE